MSAAEAGSSSPPVVPPPLDLPHLFSSFVLYRRVLLAVSGGPDSTALLLMAARWRDAHQEAPALHVASVDHGLRPEAREEAEAVGHLASALGLPHVVLDWDGTVARSGVQEAARHARYELLLAHAGMIGAEAIATAHTADDQAETVLFRLMRGSGLSGLAGIPARRELGEVALLRPLLPLRKAQLVAVCREAGIGYADDPSNRNPRFARTRLRELLPRLEAEGLDAPRFARLASRLARADAALEAATDSALATVVIGGWEEGGVIRLDRSALAALPEEIRLRLLGRAVAMVGIEGPVELAKLEALHDWLRGLAAGEAGARTLAGALVRVGSRMVRLVPAPPRRR